MAGDHLFRIAAGLPKSLGATREQRVDRALTILLVAQCLTLFVALPLGAVLPGARMMMDLSHLVFAAICILVLSHHRMVQAVLLAGLAVLAAGPLGGYRYAIWLGLTSNDLHDLIALVAFTFNGLVTVLVARHVFGADRVTASRIQGAVLLYLNIAGLFGILYSALHAHIPGAFVSSAASGADDSRSVQSAAMTYFSLSTITTAGYGDFVPASPLARSLANLEAVIGQLYPATMIARLVGLHLSHSRDESDMASR